MSRALVAVSVAFAVACANGQAPADPGGGPQTNTGGAADAGSPADPAADAGTGAASGGDNPGPDGGAAGVPDADGGIAGIPDADGGAAGVPGVDGGAVAAAPPPAPVLVDPDAIGTFDVSPDAQSALAFHHTFAPWTYDLVLIHGSAITTLASKDVEWAEFAPDGQYVFFAVSNGGVHVHVAGLDGVVNPDVTLGDSVPSIAGRWLYYSQRSSDGHWTAYRFAPPDGVPQLLVSGVALAALTDNSTDISVDYSADGEDYVTCVLSTATCQLVSAKNAGPVALPYNGPLARFIFSPDRNRILSGCQLYDLGGAARTVCDPAATFSTPAFSSDGSKLQINTQSEVVVLNLSTGVTVEIPFPGVQLFASFSPDGTQLVGGRDDGRFFFAPAAGGSWTELTGDTYRVKGEPDYPLGIAFGPDGRILATNSVSAGVVMSIDGAAPQTITRDGRTLLAATPVFEPAGGRGRAIFWENQSPDRLVIGNADGSGDWVEMPAPGQGFPRWTGHSVLSGVHTSINPANRSGGTYDLFVTPDDGPQRLLLSGVTDYLWTSSADHPVLFFVPAGGGLYSAPIPQPSH